MSEELQRRVKSLRRAFERLKEAENLNFVAHHPQEWPEHDRSPEEIEAIENPEQADIDLAEAWDGMRVAVYYIEKHAAKLP